MKKNKKTNRVPADELLLAKMIAATEAAGLVGCKGAPFKGADNNGVNCRKDAAACCAIRSLCLLAGTRVNQSYKAPERFGFESEPLWTGNDTEGVWSYHYDGNGDVAETIGWAFRNAMDPSLANLT